MSGLSRAEGRSASSRRPCGDIQRYTQPPSCPQEHSDQGNTAEQPRVSKSFISKEMAVVGRNSGILFLLLRNIFTGFWLVSNTRALFSPNLKQNHYNFL